MPSSYYGAPPYEGGWQEQGPTLEEVFQTVMPGWNAPTAAPLVTVRPQLVETREQAVALANGSSGGLKQGGNALLWAGLALIIGGVFIYGISR